ncbi:hypothetical protein CALVIDRAFT_89127 [Calocera viscosa TUFC12733]|uniref:Uncharacterized protein n=1 Tax=Calocera viscosa (strain TUFC12733) TaxID=1330018 RepID=A0A167N839_CALVF|nr:hypothetical protein CALVIDRAFT_89127 [Calocera viscosa TUFC12733]
MLSHSRAAGSEMEQSRHVFGSHIIVQNNAFTVLSQHRHIDSSATTAAAKPPRLRMLRGQGCPSPAGQLRVLNSSAVVDVRVAQHCLQMRLCRCWAEQRGQPGNQILPVPPQSQAMCLDAKPEIWQQQLLIISGSSAFYTANANSPSQNKPKAPTNNSSSLACDNNIPPRR